MQRLKYLAPAIAALSFVVSTAALAQPRDFPDRDHRGPGPREAYPERHYGRPPPPPPPSMRPGPPAYGPGYHFSRGERLPPPYRGYHYVVGDWRAHHLSYPPPGYQWVQNGADYLLVAIATGLIAQVILGQ